MTRGDRTVMAGVPIEAKALQGQVGGVGPDVCDVRVGDEVIFRRPGGELPEIAILDEELILGRLEFPTYGE